MNLHLNKVLIFLKQELPPAYNELIKLVNDIFVINLPNGEVFETAYQSIFPLITTSVNRIRNREYDFKFSVKSNNQERDFIILK